MFLESCYHRGDVCNQFQEGYSFGYVEGFLKCFYAIIAFAYKKGFITRDQYQESLVDEASRIHMPVMKDEDVLKKRSGTKIYNRKEIEAMRNRLGEGPSRIAFEIALNCGLRVSEVFALTWSDIDLNKAVLSVNKQLLKIGGNWCLCQPKYIASYRDVYINDYLLQLLTAEYDRQQKFGIANSLNHLQDLRISGKTSTCCIEDFLFVKNDGTMYSSNAFKYWSRVFKREVGITDFNFHSLRHTFCSELAALGCPVSELCRMAGHSSINTTMNYYISSTETAQEAARKVLNQMGNRNNCPF